MNKIIIIDGNSLLFRGYYATSYGDASNIMRTKLGTPTNAICAFSNMLIRLINPFKDDEGIFVGFDCDKDTFRKEEFAEYKANRAPCPPDLKPQFPIARELCKALNITYYEEHGIEADDICGTVAKEASKQGYQVIIYTSDHDYLQLIDKNIKVFLLKVGLSKIEEYDEKVLKEKTTLSPAQIIDFKGLRGDSSDNYPGIPGIGEKTAIKLINEYGDFESIINAAKSGKITGKIGEKIVENEELGRASFHLARIKTDVKLPFSIKDLSYKGYDFNLANDFAQKYELKQLLARLPQHLKKTNSNNVELSINEISSLKDMNLTDVKRIGLALDIDYSSYHDVEPFGISICIDKNCYYISKENFKNDSSIKELLENPEIKKNVYDGKATIYALKKYDIDIKGIDNDLLLAGYLMDSSFSPNPSLIYGAFGVDIDDNKDENITLFNYDERNINKTTKMAYFVLNLEEKIKKTLQSVNAFDLYTNIEIPLMKVLAKMELEGFPLHQDKLLEYGKIFSLKKQELEEEIYELAGNKFNINSPKQIASVLYDQMHLPHDKNAGTSVDDLMNIYSSSPIIPKILEYRKYAKLLSTYVDGLIPHIKKDGKIHSYFNQAQTSTGRLSSSSPNLQNISARDEESKKIRNAFYYDDPNVYLLSLDYSQIELRILASLSGCKSYIDVFNNGHDVHSETARRIFGHENISDNERRRAKAVNFAIIYGTSDFGLSQQIGDSPKEAHRIIESFYASYPEVKTFLDKIVTTATSQGYVTTMFGRRRYLRDINNSNYVKREAAKRAALNAPVQGSAADLIKIAMLKIDDYLTSNHLKTKLVLQIHDELIFYVPNEELDKVKNDLKFIMENAVSLPVKLTAELGYGKNWYEVK